MENLEVYIKVRDDKTNCYALSSINGKLITPWMDRIYKSNIYNEYDCIVNINVNNFMRKNIELQDFLFFKINNEGKIISKVYSALDMAELNFDGEFGITELIETRTKLLENKLSKFLKKLESNFNENHIQKLNKTLKK